VQASFDAAKPIMEQRLSRYHGDTPWDIAWNLKGKPPARKDEEWVTLPKAKLGVSRGVRQ
jgi:hypothetical protein